jgi:2-C-methyl-D-erythritol 4-phosphate cytidylyltransferase
MNIALLFAGGTGQRMNSKSKPKQFLELHGKPILIHTLEYFENHKEIDAICIVCLSGWEEELRRLLKSYQIEKVKWITAGGETGHDSIYNGLKVLVEECNADDIILIHDGVRPLITEELISANIDMVKTQGNAITVEAVAESVVVMDECDNVIDSIPKRHLTKVAKAPQSFYLKDIWEVHKLAQKDGYKSIDSSDLMHRYGRELYTVKSTPYNIKIATPSDYYVFRAIYEARENSQIFGL